MTEELNWNVEPRKYGSEDVGTVVIGDVTIEIRKCGTHSSSGSNPRSEPYFTLGITFTDGCTCGVTHYSRKAVEAYLDRVRDRAPKIKEQVDRRLALFERIKPLQRKASEASDAMFQLVEHRV